MIAATSSVRLLVMGAIVLCCALGCARGAPPPRLAGSVAAARFGPEEPATRFRVLAEATSGLDEPPVVAVAEDAGELRALWRDYRLPGAPPTVDFDQDLVLFFTERGECNDGKLEGFALTTAGELVPRVRYSGRLCNVEDRFSDCRDMRVYAAALARSAFPPGRYSIRWMEIETFVVRSPLPPAAAPLPPPPNIRPPPERDPIGPRHPRRARVVDKSSGDLGAGVWVRADAVWVPSPPWGTWPPGDDDPGELICDRDACTPVLARGACHVPECPTTGALLYGRRPLGVGEPWPTEAAAWERLVGDLGRDPALATSLGPPASFPRPGLARAPTVGWAQNRFEKGIEVAASADYARTFAGDALLGPGLRVGWHYNWPVEDTTTEGKLLEPLVGDGWGVELRVAVLRAFDGDASSRTGLRAALGLSATNAIGLRTDESRVRIASLLGLVLPEVGLARLPGESVRFSTTNALPVSVLLSPRLALELRPELSLLFGSGRTDGVLGLSLGLMWRTRQSICP